MTHEREKLKWAVQVLAMPGEVQRRLYPDFACKPDELALEWDEEFRMTAGSELRQVQLEAMQRLDRKLESMSRDGPDFSEDLWDESALCTSAHGALVRELGDAVLQQMAWPKESPPEVPRLVVPITFRGSLGVQSSQANEMATNRSLEQRWETPVSDAQSLAMVSLVDQDGLHITVQDNRDRAGRRFRFSFDRVAAYRSILEEYRTSDPPAVQHAGWTRVAPGSAWLSDLRSREPLLDVHSPDCRHYIIVTEDDVIDVLTPEEPRIVEVAPAGAGDPAPGKSGVLHDPEDREQIDELLDDLRTDRDGA